jgi:hypothetical protein
MFGRGMGKGMAFRQPRHLGCYLETVTRTFNRTKLRETRRLDNESFGRVFGNSLVTSAATSV